MGFIVHLEQVSSANNVYVMNLIVVWVSFLFFSFLSFLPPVINSGVEDFLVKLFFKIKAEAISIQGSHQLHHETPMMCMSLHFESFSIVMPVFTNKKRDSEWKSGGFGSIWGFLLSLFINPWVNCTHIKTGLSCCLSCARIKLLKDFLFSPSRTSCSSAALFHFLTAHSFVIKESWCQYSVVPLKSNN